MKRYFNLFKSVVKDPSEAVVVLHIVSVLVGHQGSYKGLTVDPPVDIEDMIVCIITITISSPELHIPLQGSGAKTLRVQEVEDASMLLVPTKLQRLLNKDIDGCLCQFCVIIPE